MQLGVSGSTIQSSHSSVRDVGVLAVWLCLTTRPCPHRAWSHARRQGLSRRHRVG